MGDATAAGRRHDSTMRRQMSAPFTQIPDTGDVLVRGGTVVDGTGAAPVDADVRVRDGIVVEVGPRLDPSGEAVVDAEGAYVTPGLVESHTHFDAAVWWDADCDPMPAHGCTTMVLANCGLGLAPLRPAESTDLVDLFAFIEDIPAEAFNLAVPWAWDTWPEYFAAARSHPTAVNYVGFMPYQMLRTWIMGPDAWERAATPQERERLVAALDEALSAGALGLSTSEMDTDKANRPVPSRLADEAELSALIAVLARHGAILQYVPRFLQPEYFHEDLSRMSRLVAGTGVRMLFAGYALEETAADGRHQLEDLMTRLRAEGADLWPNFSPRPSHVNMHFERSIMWSGVASWHSYVHASDDDKRTLLRDPAWRAAARADWDACTYTLAPIRRPEGMLLMGGERSGESLAEAVARTQQHPSDVMADWLISTDVQGNVRTRERPIDIDAAAAMARSPHALPGASDAGAHVQMFSGAGDGTYFLAHLVRDTGLLRVEEAVQAVTSRLAGFFGIPGRGVIGPGAVADLAVFALDDLRNGTEIQQRDLPGGAWRYSRTPGGYRATLVGGVPTWLNGSATGKRPGGMLPARQDQERVPAGV
jgi:N-acyl-D-aspartate/D-glutamate deacylase